MFDRLLDLSAVVASKSVLLLGPRMVGKSTLLRTCFPQALYIDLLESQTFRALAAAPEQLAERVRGALDDAGRTAVAPRSTRAGLRSGDSPKESSVVVVIDEIQKLPELLDEVHRLIESERRLRFVVTRSSARKLRGGAANLLGGRLRRVDLLPVVTAELATSNTKQDYATLLRIGGLPSVLTSDSPKEELLDYVGLYLREEIQAEGLTRSITGFARFLDVAASTNAEQVNFTAVASDAQIPVKTVREYYQILEDTLLGALVEPFQGTTRRKAVAAAKFYFFDVGVANALLGRWTPRRGTAEYGKCLEHLVFCELRAALRYQRSQAKLTYWRSQSQHEVDFVLQREDGTLLAIEVKGANHVSMRDLRGLNALAEEGLPLERWVVCEEPHARILEDGTRIEPVARFFERLWRGELLS